jgi:hypothetical protein
MGFLADGFNAGRACDRETPLPLFILVADLLQHMILLASEQGLLQHLIVDSTPCPVLQYADDTLPVVKAD